MSVVLAGVASALAVARPDAERLDADLASLIRADYSADPDGTTLAPLDEGIIDVARQDEDNLREISGVEIVPVFLLDRAGDSTSSSSDSTSGSGDSTTSGSGDSTSGSGDSTSGSGDSTSGSGDGGSGSGDGGSGSGDGGSGSGDGGSGSGDGGTGSGDGGTGSGDGGSGSGDGGSGSGDGGTSPAPTSVSFISVADSYVDTNQPDTNYGTTSTMWVKTAASGKYMRSFVRFDLSSIPAGATINSATLTLCATRVPSATRTYNVNRVNASWAETALTWNSQPALTATVTDSATTPASRGCMSWTVATDVQAWVAGTANNGWRVSESVEGDPRYTSTFRTREASVTAERPVLQVTYTSP